MTTDDRQGYEFGPMMRAQADGWVSFDELREEARRDRARARVRPTSGTVLEVRCPKGHLLLIVQRRRTDSQWRGLCGGGQPFRLDDPAQRPVRPACRCGRHGFMWWPVDLDKLRAVARQAEAAGCGEVDLSGGVAGARNAKAWRSIRVELVAPDC